MGSGSLLTNPPGSGSVYFLFYFVNMPLMDDIWFLMGKHAGFSGGFSTFQPAAAGCRLLPFTKSSSRNARRSHEKWGFPKRGVPQNGWFIRESPIKMDGEMGYPYFRNPPMLAAAKFQFQVINSRARAMVKRWFVPYRDWSSHVIITCPHHKLLGIQIVCNSTWMNDGQLSDFLINHPRHG